MTKPLRLTAGVSTLALLTSLVATGAMGQDVIDLDPITVEESRRGVATDTAAAETTLDQNELDARQPSTLAEAINTVPGVTLMNSATPQGSSINIRGLGSDTGLYGSNTKVNVVVDGVSKGQEELYRQGSLLTMEPELFKEVKVVRGPAESFRFSSGAIGGSVEAVTKDASDFLEDGDTFAFRQKLSFQNNGHGFMTSSILAWAPDDRFDVVAFLGYREAADYLDGSGTTQVDTGYSLPSGLLKAKYRVTEDLSFTASYSRTNNTLRDVSYDLMGSTFSTRVDADIEDVTAYLAMEYNPVDNDLINTTAKIVYSDELIANVSSTTSSTLYNADNRTERLAFVLENEANFETGGVEHTLLTGFEIGKRERSSISHTGGNAGSTPGGTDEYFAAYITNEMRFGAFTLTPQLRWESQTITSASNSAVADGTEYKASDWAGALAARYEVNDNFALFGTVAYNTNLPILDDLTSSTKIITTEKAVTNEAGISYQGYDVFGQGDHLQTKLTAFQTDVWSNTTYSNYAPGGNASEITLKGVEVELSYAHPDFYVDFNAARIRGQWGDGTYFNNAPADSAQLTLGKRFLDDKLDLAVEVRHDWATDRNLQHSQTAIQADAFTVTTLSAAYTPDSGALKGVELRGSIENLFDVHYQPYLTSRPAQGRTVKVSLARVF